MDRIAIIAPDQELATLCKQVISQTAYKDEFSIRVGLTKRGVSLAREEKEKGAAAIISRGGTAILIRKARLDLPVVDIEVTAYDIIYSLNHARKLGRRIAIVGFENVIEGIAGIDQALQDMSNLNITVYKVITEKEIEGVIETVSRQIGTDGLVFIGGNLVAKKARENGCAGVVLKSARESVVRAINEAKLLVETIRSEKERTNQFRTILEYISDGVLAVNREGRVTVYNRVAESIMGVRKNTVIGKPVQEVIPNTRMHEVVETGKEEIGVLQEIGSTVIVTNRTPIFADQKIIGAVATFQNVTQLQQLEQQIRKKLSRRGLMAKWTFNDIVGESQAIKKTINRAHKFAEVDNTILISAETGTGKEMFAQSIHQASKRRHGPFVAINCAALPESLLEGELFGYSEGAFTGAVKGGKPGLFELAHGGTIFLDEISEISRRLQTLFLRVLQEKEVRRVGDDRVIPVDVRVINASNRNLSVLSEEGAFRTDLYYRINVLNLEIPPLRERKEDIPLLVEHFLQKYRQDNRINLTLTPEAMEVLQQYDWPGNVRQLENVLERLVAIAESDLVNDIDVIAALQGEPRIVEEMKRMPPEHASTTGDPMDLLFLKQPDKPAQTGNLGKGLLPQMERDIILKVLSSVNGKKQEAARILGISSTTLWRRLKKLGITK